MSRQRTDLRPFNKKHVEPGRSVSLPNARTSTSGSHLVDSGIRGFGIEMRHSLPSDKRTDGSSPVINTKIDNKESSDRTCELSLKKEVEVSECINSCIYTRNFRDVSTEEHRHDELDRCKSVRRC